MKLQEAFAQRIIPLKDKLSPDDYQKVLEAAEEFGFMLMRANLLARTINSGINIRFWWMETDGKLIPKILWEADNRINGQHIDGHPEGYDTAEEAMKAIIDTINAIAKREDDEKQRIIRLN
jgi:hypothetical protein